MEEIYYFDNDEEMLSASREARSTFKYLWRELSWEYRRIVPGLDLSIVKVMFRTEGGEDIPPCEHMWVSDIQFDGVKLTGTLMNDPNWVTSVKNGDTVNVPLSEISDWLYAIEGKVYGGYTVNLMRSRMSSSERQQHDGAWGLDFGNPVEIELVPVKKRGLVSKIFGNNKAINLQLEEHPMSENMGESIETALRETPSLATDIDDEGWSMLHRESLAGNLTPVKKLIEFGADINLKNSNGHTANDLAELMGWSKLTELFKSKK